MVKFKFEASCKYLEYEKEEEEAVVSGELHIELDSETDPENWDRVAYMKASGEALDTLYMAYHDFNSCYKVYDFNVKLNLQ